MSTIELEAPHMTIYLDTVGEETSLEHPTVVYDADEMVLICTLSDQVSAYRTRKNWHSILQEHFMLNSSEDYSLKLARSGTGNTWQLHCYFDTTCGRYAFWRLISQQTPETVELLAAASQTPLRSHIDLPNVIYNHKSSRHRLPTPWWLSIISFMKRLLKL